MSPLVGAALRLLYSSYVPEPVRNSLSLELLLLQRDREPARTPAPAARRVAVLAPHMDDEVFGCGGTLALSARGGSEVTVVYLTDGSKGYAPAAIHEKSDIEIRALEADLVARRKEEARRAGTLLGLSEPLFLDLPDGAIAVTDVSTERLARALRNLRPEAIFLPFMTDLHHDHWLANGLLVQSAQAAQLSADIACWGYEVWNPTVANTVVDVSSVYDLKREAAREFASQTAGFDYVRAIEGLNTYRSLFSGRGAGYAEAFFTANLGLYRRLYDRVVIGRRSR
jgi:LmbE family N-acetylglucosaminyl deacetylase